MPRHIVETLQTSEVHPKLAMDALVRGISVVQDRSLRSAGIDLTVQQAAVLAVLQDQGTQPIQALSSCLEIDQSAISRLIDRLEDKGFTSRSGAPGDRRVANVALTPQGTEVAVAARRVIEDLKAALLADISSQDLDAFWRVIKLMRSTVARQLSTAEGD